MSPAELPLPQPPDEPSVSPKNDSADKWTLSREAFDKLLENFSPDRQEAGRLYEVMRIKLTRYFEWRSCPLPEDEVDKTINIVARRIDEGENISNLRAYFFSAARLVFKEWLRKHERTFVPLDEVPEPPDEQSFDDVQDEQKEARMRCLDQCLEKLTIENNKLILEYYHDEMRVKIDHRKQLASVLGIPLNALRIRAHRIRTFLEKCVEDCLGQTPSESKQN